MRGSCSAAAVLTIYIVLGILYESFIHPLTILTGLPAAAAGALLTLRIFNFDVDVIAIIGILMLIGIVKKNAIMMIDFALARSAPARRARGDPRRLPDPLPPDHDDDDGGHHGRAADRARRRRRARSCASRWAWRWSAACSCRRR